MVELIELILDKAELKGINREFAKKILDKHLVKNNKFITEYQKDPVNITKKKSYQKLKSEVRSELRRVYGVFFKEKYGSKKQKYVNELIRNPNIENTLKVISLHRSTSERAQAYPFLYNQIFSITGTPKKILDLGCGFNPFTYLFLNCNPEYVAVDIASEDLKLISHYFKSIKVPHETIELDLSEEKSWYKLPEADVTFAFKLFDSLEEITRNITEKALSIIKTKYLIVSFPTQSISQTKKIKERKWFEKLIGEPTSQIHLPNEQFFILTIKK